MSISGSWFLSELSARISKVINGKSIDDSELQLCGLQQHATKLVLTSQQQTEMIAPTGRDLTSLLSSEMNLSPPESSAIVPAAPQRNYIAVGLQPMMCIYSTTNHTISARQILSAVKNSVKSYAASWIPSRWAATATQAPAVACSVYAHTQFPDGRREVSSVVSDPDVGLASVADRHGRVILIDTSAGVIVRVWKGYRDAECCFRRLRPSANTPPRLARKFLAIHCPRRALVEVWELVSGGRIFAATSHGLLGQPPSPHLKAELSPTPHVFERNATTDWRSESRFFLIDPSTHRFAELDIRDIVK